MLGNLWRTAPPQRNIIMSYSKIKAAVILYSGVHSISFRNECIFLSTAHAGVWLRLRFWISADFLK